MAVLPKQVEQLTGNLVNAVTGFEADSENFHLCCQYVQSNFKYHKFLDVNDRHVSRKVKSLCEKLHIHAQPQKADALEQRVKEFIALDNSILNFDSRYSVLSTLLCLANSPVNAPYQVEDRASPVAIAEPDEGINWLEYLMEGVEIPSFTSDVESEWSVSSEEEVDEEGPLLVAALPGKGAQQHKEEEDADSAVESELEASFEGEHWLRSHLQAPYWIDSLHTIEMSVHVSEGQVVKETLWLLQGASASVVYCVTPEGKVAPNPQLHMSHLRQKCLLSSLEFFASYASKLKELTSYIASWQGHVFRSPQGPLVSPTLNASISSLNDYLQQLYHMFHEMELCHQSTETHITLLDLYTRLQGDYPVVSAVANMVVRWKDMSEWKDAAQASSDMLSALWDVLREAVCASDSKLVAVLLPLWVSVLRPYLGELGEWLWLGKEHPDLGVTRTAAIELNNPEYWTKGFHLTCKTDGSPALPNFLQAVMEPMLSAGKSLALVHSVSSSAAEQVKMSASPAVEDLNKKPSLYKEFLTILSEILEVDATEGEDSSHVPTPERATDKETVVFDSSLSIDPILTSLFNSMTTCLDSSEGGCSPMTKSCRVWGAGPAHCSCQVCLLRKLANADLPLSVPVDILLEQCLHRPIFERCKEATSALVAVLKDDHKLMQHFSNIQHIFLMEAGETMTHFCAELFTAIQKHDVWCNSSFLNALLLDALQLRLQGLEELYGIQVRGQAREKACLTVDLLNLLSLQYKVPWSLSVVITGESLDRYNEIFHFLMQIKWAKWTLESCRVRACHLQGLSDTEQSLTHRMHLLKVRLLHFINSVDSYLMTRILHTTSLDFQKKLEQVESLDEIISVHREYQSLIYDRCLLNPKAHSIKDAITSILTVCLMFGEQWSHRASVRLSALCKIESEFSKCSHFLNTILMNSVKRGSFPHLESLAFSLSLLEGNQPVFTNLQLQ